MVLQVRENIVHETRNERNSLLLLIAAVDHIQKRSQDLLIDETCQKVAHTNLKSFLVIALKRYLSQKYQSLYTVNRRG